MTLIIQVQLVLLLIVGWNNFYHSEVIRDEKISKNIYDRSQTLEWPYRRWEHTGITKQMVDCAAHHLLDHPRQFLTPAILKVSNDGRDVSISFYKYEPDVKVGEKESHRVLLSDKGDDQESNQNRRGRIVIPIHTKKNKNGKLVVIDPMEDLQKASGNDPSKIKGMSSRLQAWLKSKGISSIKKLKDEPRNSESAESKKSAEAKKPETESKKQESDHPSTTAEKIITRKTTKPIVKTIKRTKIDSAPSRMLAMESGVKQAIAYARTYLGIRRFPDIYALIVVTDADGFLEPVNSTCKDAAGNKHPWPPGQPLRDATRFLVLFVV